VILRVVSGHVQPGEIAAVAASFRRSYVSPASSAAGLERFVVAARPVDDGGHDLAALTIWSDVESALVAYGGRLQTPRTLDGHDHGVAFDRVDYYELEAGRSRTDETATPNLLRLTAGSVARGLDAEIQQQVRSRLPDLPDEALEAWVGRRVLGSVVEIAFVSTWTDAPAGVRLDGPIWPSISERYDTFRLEVHEVLLAGFGGAARTTAAR
jgi:hypothetical protein